MGLFDGLASGWDDLTHGDWGGVVQGVAETVVPTYRTSSKVIKTLSGTTPAELAVSNAGAIYNGEYGKVVSNVVSAATKTIGTVGSTALGIVKKYWYVPIIVGGVFIGYKILTNDQYKKYLTSMAQTVSKKN